MNSNKSSPDDFMHSDDELSRCDECGFKTETMIKFDNSKFSLDGEYRWAMICSDCLVKAMEMVKK